jgi:hypothetical protein
VSSIKFGQYFLLARGRQNEGLTIHNQHINTIANCLVFGIWVWWSTFHGCIFGTKVQRYHLFTLMVFDHHHQGLLVTWVIISQQTKLDLIQWLLTLKEHALKEDPTWRPSYYIVDDILQKHHAIKYKTRFTYLVHFFFV